MVKRITIETQDVTLDQLGAAVQMLEAEHSISAEVGKSRVVVNFDEAVEFSEATEVLTTVLEVIEEITTSDDEAGDA